MRRTTLARAGAAAVGMVLVAEAAVWLLRPRRAPRDGPPRAGARVRAPAAWGRGDRRRAIGGGRGGEPAGRDRRPRSRRRLRRLQAKPRLVARRRGKGGRDRGGPRPRPGGVCGRGGAPLPPPGGGPRGR